MKASLPDIPTIAQLRAARAMVEQSQEHIAREAGVSGKTIIEVERKTSRRSSLNAIVGYYLSQGLTFGGTVEAQTISYRPRAPAAAPSAPSEAAGA